MYLAKREVGALTKALQRCLARLVTSALELHGDLRAGGLLDSFFGGFVEVVGCEVDALKRRVHGQHVSKVFCSLGTEVVSGDIEGSEARVGLQSFREELGGLRIESVFAEAANCSGLPWRWHACLHRPGCCC